MGVSALKLSSPDAVLPRSAGVEGAFYRLTNKWAAFFTPHTESNEEASDANSVESDSSNEV